jgi:PadR family transcriptional regulator PadR
MGADAIYGTLNLLILRTLRAGPNHGLGIKHQVERIAEGDLRVEVGALYPALHRLHRDGYVTAEWGRSDKQRRAKVYELTAKGQAYLEGELSRWHRHIAAVGAVVGATDEQTTVE